MLVNPHPFSRAAALGCVVVILLVSTSAPAAAERDDEALCRRQLHLIGDALQQYQHEHGGQVPDWLSDLVPSYLSAEFLTCPAARRRGLTSVSATGRRNLTDRRLLTSYFYDFTAETFESSPGTRMSNREWKQLQLQIVGPVVGAVVPIVRCLSVHSTNLNLAFDGRIYESGLYWESNFADRVSASDLNGADEWVSGKVRRVVTILPRSPEATSLQLDLAGEFNGSLSQPWWPLIRRATLDGLPTGWQSLGGVRFDIRAVVQLVGNPGSLQGFPGVIRKIPVRQSARRLHVLLGLSGPVQTNSEVARIVLNYPGKRLPETISIRHGRDVLPAWPERRALEQAGELEHPPTPAWQTPVLEVGPDKRLARIYQMAAPVTSPGDWVDSLDLQAVGTYSAPFFLGITLEP